jgi:hypothetical protein
LQGRRHARTSAFTFFNSILPLKITCFEEKIYRNGEEGEEGGEKENLSVKPSSTLR